MIGSKELSPSTPDFILKEVMEAKETKGEYALILSIPVESKKLRNSGKYRVHPPSGANHFVPLETVCACTLEDSWVALTLKAEAPTLPTIESYQNACNDNYSLNLTVEQLPNT